MLNILKKHFTLFIVLLITWSCKSSEYFCHYESPFTSNEEKIMLNLHFSSDTLSQYNHAINISAILVNKSKKPMYFYDRLKIKYFVDYNDITLEMGCDPSLVSKDNDLKSLIEFEMGFIKVYPNSSVTYQLTLNHENILYAYSYRKSPFTYKEFFINAEIYYMYDISNLKYYFDKNNHLITTNIGYVFNFREKKCQTNYTLHVIDKE